MAACCMTAMSVWTQTCVASALVFAVCPFLIKASIAGSLKKLKFAEFGGNDVLAKSGKR